MVSSEAMQAIEAILQWVVAPIAAFVVLIYRQQQRHDIAIAVLQAEASTARQAHDREIKEIRETSRAIMAKLDSIEEALRK
jgi:hypothetical protein